MNGVFIEQKRRLDGTELRFECEPVDYLPRRSICLYRWPGDWQGANFTTPHGGLSYGFFWPSRPYILYRISQPDGTPIGHRFDVVDRVRHGPCGASYRDLVLDLWVPTDGAAPVVEDEDELEALIAGGLVAPGLGERARRGAAAILRGHRRIIAEVEREVAPYLPGADRLT